MTLHNSYKLCTYSEINPTVYIVYCFFLPKHTKIILHQQTLDFIFQSFGEDKQIYVYIFMFLSFYNFGLCLYAVSIMIDFTLLITSFKKYCDKVIYLTYSFTDILIFNYIFFIAWIQ